MNGKVNLPLRRGNTISRTHRGIKFYTLFNTVSLVASEKVRLMHLLLRTHKIE